jgi:heme-degrading monooxygenase HmoA
MIGVLTHHWAKPDEVDEARKLLDRNGEAQSKAHGFVSRQTLLSRSDPTKITTLVVWTTNDIYDAWRASPERAVAMLCGPSHRSQSVLTWRTNAERRGQTQERRRRRRKGI